MGVGGTLTPGGKGCTLASMASQGRGRADRAYQRADALGFRYRGKEYDGFADDPGFPMAVRQQVARWAVATRAATHEQQVMADLSSVTRDEPVRDELLDVLDREEQLLDRPSFAASLEALTEDDRARLLRPHAFLERDFAWPLPIKDAALLVGVSDKQLRDWDNEGVCPAERWGAGRYRGYFRSQLLIAMLIRTSLAEGYSLEQIRTDLGLRERPAAAEDLIALIRERKDLVPA